VPHYPSANPCFHHSPVRVSISIQFAVQATFPKHLSFIPVFSIHSCHHLQHGKQNTNSTDHNRTEAESLLRRSTKWHRQRRRRKRTRSISERRRNISAAGDRSRITGRRGSERQTNWRNRRRRRGGTITRGPSGAHTSARTRGNRDRDSCLALSPGGVGS